MGKSRVVTLKAMLDSDPQDSFARYALGLEYMGCNNFDEARNMFEELTTLDPNYTATYYQLGKVYEHLGDVQKALKIYEKGIYVASSHNDNHTKTELEMALNELL